ncbi:MAG TPA: alpha/beta fold hydrolase [Casimicrobiaceae bacterium]|nr:alpha/beta fold hydrolase [Casimicrobiaceae bacterium]
MTRSLALAATFLAVLLRCSAALAYLPPEGVQFELVEFKSGERVVQGGMFTPDPKIHPKPTVGIVVVHGVESYWYTGLPMFLAGNLAERGYATLGYNGIHSGASFRTSEFEAAVREVGDAVAFLKARGFKDIVLVGHSLGTPIVEAYQGGQPDSSIRGLAVYGPHIDIPAVTRDALLGPELYAKFLAECRELVAQGRGDEIKLLAYREGQVIVTSARTFLSYRDVDTSKARVETAIRRIKVPILIVYDPADNIRGKGELIKRETIVSQIRQNAVASPRVDVTVIPSIPGSTPLQAHAFVKNEAVVTEKTLEWLKGIGLAPPSAPR